MVAYFSHLHGHSDANVNDSKYKLLIIGTCATLQEEIGEGSLTEILDHDFLM